MISRDRPLPAARRPCGFSLLEVLVAFSILTISTGALLTAFSSGARQSALARDYSRAVVLAESRLAEIGVVEPLAEGKQEGEVDTRFAWRTEVSEYQTDTEDIQRPGALRAYRVTARVDWEAQGQIRSVVLSSLRLGRGS